MTLLQILKKSGFKVSDATRARLGNYIRNRFNEIGITDLVYKRVKERSYTVVLYDRKYINEIGTLILDYKQNHPEEVFTRLRKRKRIQRA